MQLKQSALLKPMSKPHLIGMKAKARTGLEFLEELRAAYHRILDHPLGYQDLRSGIRRCVNSPDFLTQSISRSKKKRL